VLIAMAAAVRSTISFSEKTHFGDVNSLLHEGLVMADAAPTLKIARKNAVSLIAL
jgi:hypothetical protein